MEHKKNRRVGVHDGMFHADEVTACALLLLFDLVDKDEIIRTRDPTLLATCEYVCDVGGVYDPSKKLFDHHQVSYQGPLSSAGMILNFLKEKNYLDDEEYQFFQGSLIKGVDDHDNGRAPQLYGTCTFSHVIANFAPSAYAASAEQLNTLFFQALDFVVGHLKRMRDRLLYTRSCRSIVQKAMVNRSLCLVFDTSISWLESFFALGGKDHPALFVIMPSQNHWKLRGIPPDLDHRMQVRLPLPKKWAGLLDQELKQVSGLPGAIFCHKGLFISVWETKADAIQALKYVLEQGGIKSDNII